MTFVRTLLLVLLVAVSCCSSNRDSGTLSEEKYAQVYALLTKHGISLRRAGADTSLARKTADSILATAGISAHQVLATTEKFNRDPSTWKEVMDMVGKAMRDTSLR
jgi:lambda repressor-like predicted transcriptional regulator